MAQKSNPIPELLDLISPEGSILGLLAADEMRAIILRHTSKIVNNSYIIILLAHLQDAGLISVDELSWPHTAGNIIIIKRKENGTCI